MASPALSLAIDGSAATPLYRQIYERLRGAILAGELPPGARLPSARSLATQLSVARGTIEIALQLLAGEGYVAARGAAGTFVAEGGVIEGGVARAAAAPAPDDARPSELYGFGPAPVGGTLLRMGAPAFDAFPRKLWARLGARVARAVAIRDLDYPAPEGLPALRHSIAAYLRIARGIVCTPGQIFITTGYQGALAFIAQAMLCAGDGIWVEDPGYFFGRRALALAGGTLLPMPIDGAGLDVEAAVKAASEARFAVVTPCHQFPTGATLPIARRFALLDWAKAAGAWIIEDDYDSEFRYRGRPLPALKSIDQHQRVLYVGTFSKVMFPGLRMGYLVVPDRLAARFQDVAAAFQPAPPTLPQQIVSAFIDDGHFARHIRRMRYLYAERRTALAASLAEAASDDLAIEVLPGGMHLLARLRGRPRAGHDEAPVIAAANARGLWPAPLSSCYVASPPVAGLLLGFTNVAPEAAPTTALRLAEALRHSTDATNAMTRS